ncbi:alanyl-tRNA editing protein [Clostridium sp. UBA5712]|uniref:alanyl-tRNA editing protein n=1 Tax=Clostridium sp. UBA5712 TaxID=1946368 RepID=UPI003216B9F7
MEKLYYKDQYIKEFVAELEKVEEKDGKFHVVLDKTAFFPGGGGQFCDLGFIENEPVIDVYEEEGIIYHVLNKKPIKLHKLKCSIDWERRRDGMDQHLGQHVLSGCFYKIFNANTVGFHMGREICTVDIEGILEEEKIREAEKAANLIIGDDLQVEFLVPDKKELKKMGLRRALPNTNEEIRVVKISDLDINACCGVHPKSTLELRMIKVRRWEKHKGATRIEYVAGKRAIEDSFRKDKFTTRVCRYLNASEDEAINGIKNMNENLKAALDKNKKLSEEVAAYEVKDMVEKGEKVENIIIVKKVYDNEDIKYVNKVTSKIIENNNTIALMAIKNGERANLIFAASKDFKGISMNELLKDAITLIDGKGGGSSHQAQGGGKNNNNLEGALDYAINKIKGK